MSDRCGVKIVCSKADAPLVEAVFDACETSDSELLKKYPVSNSGPCVEIDFEEISGIHEIEQRLDRLNIAFIGSHGSSHTYDAYCFASDGKEWCSAPMLSHCGNVGPAVELHRCGQLASGSLELAHKFWSIFDRAVDMLQYEIGAGDIPWHP